MLNSSLPNSGFWKIPGEDITIFAFIVSMLLDDICFELCPSLIVSTVIGRVFFIPSVLITSVCRDTSSKLCPYVCSREFKIALADLIWSPNTTHVDGC